MHKQNSTRKQRLRQSCGLPHPTLISLSTSCKCNTKPSPSMNPWLLWSVEVMSQGEAKYIVLWHYFLTLKISFTLLSMKTTIRSSFSLERALLWRTALEKDFFTVSLFSIYRFNNTSLMSNHKMTNNNKKTGGKVFLPTLISPASDLFTWGKME